MVVGIVCDDPLLREALESLIASKEGFSVVHATNDVRSSIGQFVKQTPDAIVAVQEDLSQEDWTMLSALKTLTSVRIVGVARTESAKRDMSVDVAMRRDEGAAALFKLLGATKGGAAAPVAAVAEARAEYTPVSKKVRLTPRETEVAGLVAQGLPNRRIGQVMGLQEQSVKNLVSVVMRKLNCENRVQIALKLSGILKESTSRG